MRFSVVIPTRNRSQKLEKCLKALFEQDYDHSQFEIVVVDDGSTDNTQEVLEKIKAQSPVQLHIFRQENRGQGAARNKGIEESHGKIILFLGDDIVVSKDVLREHDKIHRLHPEENAAVLGFITWHPNLPVTPLMRFMERGGAILGKFGGQQFAFDLLKGKNIADHRFFYTSNISLKRSLLQKQKFDPQFASYGWEDIELGYRLEKQAGLVLYYMPTAIAYHDHAVNCEQWANRMRKVGSSSWIIHKKYPELRKVPGWSKRIAFRTLSHPLSLVLLKTLNNDFYFYALSKKYFLEGLAEGYNKKCP